MTMHLPPRIIYCWLLPVLWTTAPAAIWAQAPDTSQSATSQPATSQSATSQSATSQSAGPASTPRAADVFPELIIPEDASIAQLEALVAAAKALRPRNPQQYQAMQSAIRDGSKQILKQLDSDPQRQGSKETPVYQQAEVDVIAASVALMTYFGPDAKQKTLQQVHEFLKSRKELSLQDIQTGMLAAAMLELQPNKQPARDTYALLDELLKEDEREEMQSLRLNLQASIRRLDLLGNKFDFAGTTVDGRSLSTDDLAGKFVIVDFFATWCEPCLAEVPHLKKHFEKYHPKGLEVIGISLDEEAAGLKEYLQRAELPWPVIHDDHEDPLQRLQMKFGIAHLPTVLLLNKEGTVVSLAARGGELDRLMQMLFDAPTPAEPVPDESETPKPVPKAQSRVESASSPGE